MTSKAGKLKLSVKGGSNEKGRGGRDSQQSGDNDRPSVFSRLGTKMRGGARGQWRAGASPSKKKEGEKQ